MAHNYKLLKSVLSHVWAITPAAAEAYYPSIINLLKGVDAGLNTNIVTREVVEMYATAVSGEKKSAAYSNDKPSGNSKVVAIIPIKDVIIKYDAECGPYGTETVAQWILRADQNPNVSAIILDIDSPGGDGMAVQYISEVIKNASKPVIAYCGNGMTASAAYWIASNCKEIYATYETDEIGSIGTYITIADFKAFYEAQGLKIHEIYATKSTEKNKPFKDALEGKYDNLRTNVIDPFNEQFINTIKENRPNVNESVFKGALYSAKEAIEMGLIDGLKTMDEVVQRAFELSSSENSSSTNSNTKNMFGNKKTTFAALTAFAALKPEERTPDMLAGVNAELKANGIDGELMSTEVIAANAKSLSDEKAALVKANADLATANTRVTELEAMAKENGIKTTKEKTDDVDPKNTEEKKYETSIDREKRELMENLSN